MPAYTEEEDLKSIPISSRILDAGNNNVNTNSNSTTKVQTGPDVVEPTTEEGAEFQFGGTSAYDRGTEGATPLDEKAEYQNDYDRISTNVSTSAFDRAGEKPKNNYRTYGGEDDRWWETVKNGGLAFLMTGNPAIALVAGFASYADMQDKQHREGQINDLETQGYSPQAIDAWVEMGDNKLLVEGKPKEDTFMNTSRGIMNMNTKQIVAGTEPEAKIEWRTQKRRDGSTFQVMQKSGQDATDENGRPITREGDAAPIVKATGTGSSRAQDWETIGVAEDKTKVIQQVWDPRTNAWAVDAQGNIITREIYSKDAAKDQAASTAPVKLTAAELKAQESDGAKYGDIAGGYQGPLELANSIDAVKGDWRTGLRGNVESKLRDVFGGQDEVERLRLQHTEQFNKSVIGSLPPGVATDADIRIFSKGFPSANWPAEDVASWLRGQAKVEYYREKDLEFRMEWRSNNGGLSRKDSEGQTYIQARKEAVKNWGGEFQSLLGEESAPRQAPATQAAPAATPPGSDASASGGYDRATAARMVASGQFSGEPVQSKDGTWWLKKSGATTNKKSDYVQVY